ncbi:MAG: hypothetical protein IJT87_03100 [Ruminiclostridium sp.]|nr:hypothetical protein [Ruminiclostridium sp.]
MNAELLFETIGDINEDFIKEAVQMERKKNYKWVKYAVATAACLGIGVGAVAVFNQTQSVPIEPASTVSSTTTNESNNAVSDVSVPAEEIEEISDSGAGAGDYNAAIMIGGVIYWDTYKTMPVEPDETAIQYAGSYAESGMPEKDGETNFAREPGTRYAVLDDGTVVVEIDGEWTIFAAKESSVGSIDGTVPGGVVSSGIDPVKASIAVFPATATIEDVADATLTSLTEAEAKQLSGIGKHLPTVLPDGYSMERASSYETKMNNGTVYRMLRTQYCDNERKTNELNIAIFNFRPDSDMPIYDSIDELPADLDPLDVFFVKTGDVCALVSASDLSLDEIKNVLRSMNG